MINTAHVISLPHRTDRRKSVRRELDRMGLHTIFHDAPHVTRDGHLGCTLGHYYAVKDAMMGNWSAMPPQLIVEDDALFMYPREEVFKALEEFQRLHGDNWDALFIGSFYQAYYDPKVERFPRPFKMNQATAYILNHRFAEEWLEYLEVCVLKRMRSPQGLNGILDQGWNDLLKEKLIFCSDPKLVAQADNHSDILHAQSMGGVCRPLNLG